MKGSRDVEGAELLTTI